MSRAVLSLGSNLGDRWGYLRSAVAGLGDRVIAVSAIYETPPWGDSDQPMYLNAVVLAYAKDDDPWYWLHMAQQLEDAAMRRRDPARRFGPRTLDVDVIAMCTDDGFPVICDDPRLTLPHPRASSRAFVLRPWLDIQPHAELPGYGKLHDLVENDKIAMDMAQMRPWKNEVLWKWSNPRC